MGEGIVREFGIDMYRLLYLKWITNKDLLYSTENSAQCYMAAWTGGECGGVRVGGLSRGQIVKGLWGAVKGFEAEKGLD